MTFFPLYCLEFKAKDYQNSDIKGKNAIIKRLQDSGMKCLNWASSMEHTNTSVEEAVDTAKKGMMTRHLVLQLFKKRGLKTL